MANTSFRSYWRWIVFLSLVAGFGVVAPTVAAPNLQLNYQGKLTNSAGTIVADNSYSIVFNLYTAASGGSSIWTESRTGANKVSVTDGLFSIMLGSVTSLSSVDFNQTLYLGVNVESDGEMTPRKILGAVPAAFEANKIDGLDSTDLLRLSYDSTIASSTTSTLLTVNQSGTGGIFDLKDGGTSVFTVIDGGNVGVGSSTPMAKFTVVGNILATQGSAPTLVASTTANISSPSGVAVVGKYAYVTSQDNDTLAIFDIASSTVLTARGTTTTNLINPQKVAVAGRYAYVASAGNDRLAIFDISNSNSIAARGFISTTNIDNPKDIYVSGKYAYVVSDGALVDALAIFDISNPDAIVAKGAITTNLDSPRAIQVVGNYAYVASTGNNTLAIFDVGDPDNIVAKDTITTNLNSPRSIFVSGQYAYLVNGQSGALRIYDIANPDDIVAKGITSDNILNNNSGVFVSGRYAYVAKNAALTVYDVSNPESITTLGVLSSGVGGPTKMVVLGKYLYMTNDGSSVDNFSVYELNHIDVPNIVAGSVQVGNLEVFDNAFINNDLRVRSGLIIGQNSLLQGSLSVASSTALALGINTQVSVGTTTPYARLSVWGSGTGTGKLLELVDSASTTRLLVQDNGLVGIATSTPISTLSIQGSLCVRDTGSCGTGAGEIYTTGGNIVSIDVAENYPTRDQTIEAGDIVSLSSQLSSYPNPTRAAVNSGDRETIGTLVKAQASQTEPVLGVISTKPGLLFGYDIKEVPVRPVALVGRIPVKVSLEHGPISVGDRIGLSAIPGVGAKATSTGATVGLALEPFDEASPKNSQGIGSIVLFANLAWSPLAPAVVGDSINNLFTIDPATSRIRSLLPLDLTDQDLFNVRSILGSNNRWSINEAGLLRVEEVRANRLCLGDICVTERTLEELLKRNGVPYTPSSTIPVSPTVFSGGGGGADNNQTDNNQTNNDQVAPPVEAEVVPPPVVEVEVVPPSPSPPSVEAPVSL